MKLIDKDALVAEIERRIEEITQTISLGDKKIQKSGGNRRAELVRFLSFLNTLEVKDVDLEKVFNDEYSKFSNDVDAMDYSFPIDLADYKDFAKHFYELGIKSARKGE